MKDFNTIEQGVLERIRREHIAPIPRWRVLVREYSYWILFIALFAVSALVCGVVLFLVLENESGAAELRSGAATPLLASVPVAWMVALLAAGFSGFLAFRSTSSGYRHQKVLATSLVAVLLVGSVFYGMSGAERLERLTARTVPDYSSAVVSKTTLWSQEDKGLIGGTVLSVDETGAFEVEGFNGKHYSVSAPLLSKESSTFIKPGSEVKLVGRIKQASRETADQLPRAMNTRAVMASSSATNTIQLMSLPTPEAGDDDSSHQSSLTDEQKTGDDSTDSKNRQRGKNRARSLGVPVQAPTPLQMSEVKQEDSRRSKSRKEEIQTEKEDFDADSVRPWRD